jgi:hypothetical protein
VGIFTTYARPRSIYAAFADLINHRPPEWLQRTLLKRFSPHSGTFHPIEDGLGELNLDMYLIKVVTLPTVAGRTLSAEELLTQIRLDLNSFVDRDYAEFYPYYPRYNPRVLRDKIAWESDNPVGAVLSIDMNWGIVNTEDGSVVCSLHSPRRWIFTTLRTPQDSSHPVSGNREFGFFSSQDGWMFYVRGADRVTDGLTWAVTPIPFVLADSLWCSFQEKVSAFVNQNGGSAIVEPDPISERVPWGGVELLFFKPQVPIINGLNAANE